MKIFFYINVYIFLNSVIFLIITYTTSGACTMMVDEQIQSYRISFELTKPDHSNPALLVPWCWSSSFLVNAGFDPEFVEHMHMNVRTANHEPWLKVKGFAKG